MPINRKTRRINLADHFGRPSSIFSSLAYHKARRGGIVFPINRSTNSLMKADIRYQLRRITVFTFNLGYYIKFAGKTLTLLEQISRRRRIG